jgi:prepilin-type N-terminal cleavage/methylation domain-containing protein
MTKMIQAVKNRKGFTLMELIVVLIILAILIAALAPVLIGWINDARETAIRAEGRTVLLAMQTTITEARGTGNWSNAARDPYEGVSAPRLIADQRFINLMTESGMLGPNKYTLAGLFAAWDSTGTIPAITGLYFDNGSATTGNLIGIRIRNTSSATRNSDAVNVGMLLVGNAGNHPPVQPLP